MLKPILLLGALLTAAAAPPAALSLEETFETYVQVIVRGDTPSKEKLRHHLRAFANSDSIDVTVNAIDALQLPKAAFNGTAMEPVASALEMRQKALSCTITDITRETVHSTPQATVAYRCAFPDLSGFFPTYRDAQKRRADVGRDDPEHAKALFVAFANALRDAPDRSHEGSAVFLQARGNREFYELKTKRSELAIIYDRLKEFSSSGYAPAMNDTVYYKLSVGRNPNYPRRCKFGPGGADIA